MNDKIQFKIVRIIFLFLIQSHTLFAQEVRYRGEITLTSGSFNGRTFVKEFKQDSILIETKMRGKNIYVDQFLPAHQVATIKVYSKFKHGRGAAKGALIGLGIGTFLGLISAVTASEDDYFYVTPLQGLIFFNVLTTPMPTLVGLVGGSRKSKKFIINGNIDAYNSQREEMQHLLTK